MPKCPNKKPPPDDPNKAAKAVVDKLAAMTEADDDCPGNGPNQDSGLASPHSSDKAPESDRS